MTRAPRLDYTRSEYIERLTRQLDVLAMAGVELGRAVGRGEKFPTMTQILYDNEILELSSRIIKEAGNHYDCAEKGGVG
ncbi:hypothetical protein R80B4_00945 [Fibrobacteres bacterium R8-0-B4]